MESLTNDIYDAAKKIIEEVCTFELDAPLNEILLNLLLSLLSFVNSLLLNTVNILKINE